MARGKGDDASDLPRIGGMQRSRLEASFPGMLGSTGTVLPVIGSQVRVA